MLLSYLNTLISSLFLLNWGMKYLKCILWFLSITNQRIFFLHEHLLNSLVFIESLIKIIKFCHDEQHLTLIMTIIQILSTRVLFKCNPLVVHKIYYLQLMYFQEIPVIRFFVGLHCTRSPKKYVIAFLCFRWCLTNKKSFKNSELKLGDLFNA